MGSMAAPDSNTFDSIVPKEEPVEDDFSSSTPSTPEAGPDLEAPTQPDQPPVQKKKGGRKPIYATSEERKQRNRQAQAAFRERRTEYIKQLENTIKHHEETLQTLQQSHRNAADECLMLRYKNSLLERILLEKGIDVRAELRLKGSPQLGPARPTLAATSQASPIQRVAMSRQQQARRNPTFMPPLQPPTPPSQHSSPTASKSPNFAMQGGMSSPTSDLQAQHLQHHPAPLPPQRPDSFTPRPLLARSQSGSVSASPANPPLAPQLSMQRAMQTHYYPTTFQKHYDQLDQEYDAQANMVDDLDGEEIEPDSFIPNFRLPATDTSASMTIQGSPPLAQSSASDSVGTPAGAEHHTFDPFDPMLDADPFGLTASMHFPTPFGFDHAHARR